MSEHIEVKLDFIPVEERLPEDQFIKLVLARTAGLDLAYYHHQRGIEGWWNVFTGQLAGVTHWAEIPEMK